MSLTDFECLTHVGGVSAITATKKDRRRKSSRFGYLREKKVSSHGLVYVARPKWMRLQINASAFSIDEKDLAKPSGAPPSSATLNEESLDGSSLEIVIGWVLSVSTSVLSQYSQLSCMLDDYKGHSTGDIAVDSKGFDTFDDKVVQHISLPYENTFEDEPFERYS